VTIRRQVEAEQLRVFATLAKLAPGGSRPEFREDDAVVAAHWHSFQRVRFVRPPSAHACSLNPSGAIGVPCSIRLFRILQILERPQCISAAASWSVSAPAFVSSCRYALTFSPCVFTAWRAPV